VRRTIFHQYRYVDYGSDRYRSAGDPPAGIPGIPATALLGHAAEMFRAMGDPARLRLPDMLQGGERCVGEPVGARDKPAPSRRGFGPCIAPDCCTGAARPDTSTTGSPTGT
jgi:hypothetical protein